jgi:glutamate--cysteine ligase
MNIHQKILSILKEAPAQVEEWFKSKYSVNRPVLYTSVDIRDSGHKIVPVDTNIFPAGFNNISTKTFDKAAEEIDLFLRFFPENHNILILQENIDRNPFYTKNLEVISRLIANTGRKVEVAKIEEIEEKEKRIVLNSNFYPDVIILNHDLTSGIPEILKGCVQPIIPKPDLGWFNRRKSRHFTIYNQVIEEFCKEFDLNKFFLSTEFYECSVVDFLNQTGLDCVANKVDKMMFHLTNEYKKYGIQDQPYAFVKSDKGTYGMGITTLKSGEEIYHMNRDLRKKMGVIKSGVQNSCVLIQEGIKTANTYQGYVAENMVYLIAGNVIDSMIRIHKERSPFESLNRQGAEFRSLADIEVEQYVGKVQCYNLIARLASLAASLE